MKISFISNTVLNLIVQKINKQFGIKSNIHFGDIVSILNQFDDFIEDDFVIIHLDTIFQNIEKETLDFTINAIKNFSSKVNANILVSTFFNPNPISSLKTASSQFEIYDNFKSLKTCKNVYEFDFLKLLLKTSLNETYNYNSGILYQMPYKKPMIEALNSEWSALITFFSEPEKKVIITDADNTLWGGILGEDGIENLKINQNADGIVFQEYQKFLKQKKEEGFLLAICSKNNFEDVADAFQKLNMPLKWDDFIAKEINWEPKYLNIEKIAKQLNLGTSSFIFIDDNEFEIDSVKNSGNNVSTFLFKPEYSNLLDLKDEYAFKRKVILQEDKEKHQKYLENEKRDQTKENSGSFEDYIKALNIINKLEVNEENSLLRLSQMTEKTNQFNFNKISYSEMGLKSYIKNGNYIISYSSADKFGDYGIIGLALLEIKENNAKLENMLMSCRALGKGIENSFYNDILQFLEEKSITLSEIEFKITEKNKPAEQFYNSIYKQYFNGSEFTKITKNI